MVTKMKHFLLDCEDGGEWVWSVVAWEGVEVSSIRYNFLFSHPELPFETTSQFQNRRRKYQWPEPETASEQNLSSEEIKESLTGDPVKVVITKDPSGLGFTIIGGDRPGKLLQIHSIVQGGVVDRDGRLKVGDVLVRVNGESVVTKNHQKAVNLLQSIPSHSPVELEVRRGYPLPESVIDKEPTSGTVVQTVGGFLFQANFFNYFTDHHYLVAVIIIAVTTSLLSGVSWESCPNTFYYNYTCK